MELRYFEHLFAEISVAMGFRASRYDLWLAVWSHCGDPVELSRSSTERFLASGLDSFLTEEGASLSPSAKAKLSKTLLRFDPTHRTPEEWALRLTTPAS